MAPFTENISYSAHHLKMTISQRNSLCFRNFFIKALYYTIQLLLIFKSILSWIYSSFTSIEELLSSFDKRALIIMPMYSTGISLIRDHHLNSIDYFTISSSQKLYLSINCKKIFFLIEPIYFCLTISHSSLKKKLPFFRLLSKQKRSIILCKYYFN